MQNSLITSKIFMHNSFLVTGAGGQLGQCFKAVASAFPQYRLIFASRDEVDLNSPETLEKIYIKNPFHGIINCAAYTQVDLAESEKQKAISVNLKGVENLIDFTLSRQIKIIHFSTDFVFDGMQKRLYNETDIPRPLSVYGQTKRAGEQLLEAMDQPSTIIRTSWLFSPYGRNFVKTILDKIKSNEKLMIISDQFGKPTSGLDLASAVLRSLDHPSLFDFPLYHFAQEPTTSWYGFAQKILELSGGKSIIKPIASSDFPIITQRPHHSVLGTKHIQKTLSLDIRNWEASLEECINQIKANELL